MERSFSSSYRQEGSEIILRKLQEAGAKPQTLQDVKIVLLRKRRLRLISRKVPLQQSEFRHDNG